MKTTMLASVIVLSVALAAPAFAAGTNDPAENDLLAAQKATQEHDSAQAMAALDRAQSELLGNGTTKTRPARDAQRANSVITEIGKAKEAVKNQNWQNANQYIADAMAQPSTERR